MFDLITAVLAWFYSVWPSFGMSIMFLTVLAMVVVTPLTMKGTRSMLQMQLLAPELKRIQNQYKGDRQALNEASMAFYKEHNVNPVGGCLPLLVQAPIFLVLYQVVHGLTRRTSEIGTQVGFTSFKYATAQGSVDPGYSGTPIRRGELTFDPDFLSESTQLYTDLSRKSEMVSWGVDLSRSASTAIGDGVIAAVPYLLMMVMVLITSLYQQHQIQRRQSSAVINPTQQTIMKLLPYFLPIVSYGIPAAVVVYFIVSALFRIAQQAYITKSLYSDEESPGAQLARQRKQDSGQDGQARATSKGKTERSSRSFTPAKGVPTPKRGAKRDTGTSGRKASRSRSQGAQRPSAPSRKSRASSTSRGAASSGRSGKAPSRQRRGGGRTTPPGSSGGSRNRRKSNRSKSKRKRR